MSKQSPCTLCGTVPPSDDMYDVIVRKREPKENRRSKRSSCNKYLPPVRYTVRHLYLCNDCAQEFIRFLDTFEEV